MLFGDTTVGDTTNLVPFAYSTVLVNCGIIVTLE